MERVYDLEERTALFAEHIIAYAESLPKTVGNERIRGQMIDSGTSVGANYIEAKENLGKKDRLMHLKISRKEAKETAYWLRLSRPSDVQLGTKQQLMKEADELKRIFSSLIDKSELSDN